MRFFPSDAHLQPFFNISDYHGLPHPNLRMQTLSRPRQKACLNLQKRSFEPSRCCLPRPARPTVLGVQGFGAFLCCGSLRRRPYKFAWLVLDDPCLSCIHASCKLSTLSLETICKQWSAIFSLAASQSCEVPSSFEAKPWSGERVCRAVAGLAVMVQFAGLSRARFHGFPILIFGCQTCMVSTISTLSMIYHHQIATLSVVLKPRS